MKNDTNNDTLVGLRPISRLFSMLTYQALLST